jgi:hypothetical protein
MASEKMRYFKTYPARDAFTKSGLRTLLLHQLEEFPRSELAGMVRIMTIAEMTGNYKLIAQLVPMNGQRSGILLAALIEEVKDKQGVISEASETIISQLTDALYSAAQSLCDQQSYKEAATIVSFILTIIEREMQYVYDEGFTFQCIEEEGTRLLANIASKSQEGQ